MKSLIFFLALHVSAVVALAILGISLNGTIAKYASDYQGLTTVFSVAFGAYCFAINYLYHKSPSVHLWVNRALMAIRRTHTYWLPAFKFEKPGTSLEERQQLIDEIRSRLDSLPHKGTRLLERTAHSAKLCFDDKFFIVLRIEPDYVFITLDRKILVPSHLYESYQRTLASVGEVVGEVVKPDSINFSVDITFDEAVENPYYGFFVRRVPSHVLRHFEASFQFGHGSYKIDVGTTGISIEGTRLIEFFQGMSQVLALKALPNSGSME